LKRFLSFLLVTVLLFCASCNSAPAGGAQNAENTQAGADVSQTVGAANTETAPVIAPESAPENVPAEKIKIMTTIFPPYDFAREITGGLAEIGMLLPPGQESHSFQPSPQDIINIMDSDIFIYTGGETDVWITEMLETMDTSSMKIIKMMDCVTLKEEEIVEGMEDDEHDHGAEGAEAHAEDDHAEGEEAHAEDDHDHAEGEEAHADDDHDHAEGEEAHAEDDHDHAEGEEAHAEDEEAHAEGEEPHAEDDHDHAEGEAHTHDGEVVYDEHVWTSPANAVTIVNAISDALCEMDAANAQTYIKNTEVYTAKIVELDAQFRSVVDSSVRKTIIVGDRFPFRYFVDEYGLDYYAAFPGCSTETEPSAATVAFLIDKVKDEKIPVVFHMELSNQRMAITISEETGAKDLLLHSCHNLPKDEFEAGASYLALMQNNVTTLKEALS
jgi:zinc transport system substrate-binding protein